MVSTLTNCAENSDESVSMSVHRLLAMSYLGLNESDKALLHAREILKINPKYKPSPITDTKEFIDLIESILVIPKFSIGVAFSIGSLTSTPKVQASHSVYFPSYPCFFFSIGDR